MFETGRITCGLGGLCHGEGAASQGKAARLKGRVLIDPICVGLKRGARLALRHRSEQVKVCIEPGEPTLPVNPRWERKVLYETIALKKEGPVASVILNRPEVMNAISPRMFEEIHDALQVVNTDSSIRVVILTGAGRAFCAAVDIDEESKGKDRFLPDMDPGAQREFIRSLPQNVTRAIVNLEKPTIAMVNGPAVGDGFDWVLACDLKVASTKARFMCGFIRMGLIPDTGATWFYPRLLGLSKTFEMFFTESWLEAEEAYRIGLLNRLVAPEALERETMDLANKVARQSPIAMKLTKKHVYRGLKMSLDEALEMAVDGEIVALSTEDHREALAAFREKRAPVFKGK